MNHDQPWARSTLSAGSARAIRGWGEAATSAPNASAERRKGGEAPLRGLRNIVSKPPPPEPVAVAVPRPVDQERLALELVAPDEAPVTAVLGVVPVVAHDEVRVGRDLGRLAAVG